MEKNIKADENYEKYLYKFKEYTQFIILSTIITTLSFILAFYLMYIYNGDSPPIGLIFLFAPVLIMLYIIVPLSLIFVIYYLIRKRFWIYKPYFIITIICAIIIIIEFMIIHQ